ncbi:bola-like protein [Nemania sp. NC0429]|nr:bola-like protein [Nemania sp. NC0429]
MLGSSCCRIIASAALRQAPTAVRASPLSRIPSHIQRARTFPETPLPGRLRFSTTSDATSTTASTTPASPPEPALPEKPDYLNDAESAIWDKLVAEFSPTELLVQDVSGGCGSMYGIEISSEKFRGVNMLKQQRMVNAVLDDEMKNWHGIQLRTRVPQ